ncbi:PilZ domain-containing protein [Shewanella dokdonensis]|uniref:PilZ domain-containing protein n=1 Tax=Shewanella dokdonensis TaxID=712036 RepID=A0ABX8DGR7_9GAMM|nr:PilZ domain-containing protein [Shewanella dokdonensis]MCL1075192.1 PilZ domain-containing protein [Shewanella dokdonensis]QVK23570.1 PilZ domain-containing protein [Shewanella dokdonensis]
MGDDNVESFKERRASLRVDLEAEEIRINWQDKEEKPHSDTAICIDLSRKGLLLEYRQPFITGTLLEVTFNSGSDAQNIVKGQVCRCTESQTGYRIALQLF